MSIPENMKQITEVAEKLTATAETERNIVLSEEQLKKQGQRIIFQNDAPDKTELVLGDEFEVKMENGKTFVVRKQPQYPKNYKECCEVLSLGEDGKLYTKGYKASLISDFHKLLICRDAYWKLAGDWKPDYINTSQKKFAIDMVEYRISFEVYSGYNSILVFPTEEMRDAFYENFKDLIEECKELL